MSKSSKKNAVRPTWRQPTHTEIALGVVLVKLLLVLAISISQDLVRIDLHGDLPPQHLVVSPIPS